MSKLVIKNNINSELAITHVDNKPAKSIVGSDITVAVDTINDFPLDASDGDTVIVRDLNRGGTFIYDSSKVAEHNDGTNFNGWIRQYSGAVNVKWFGAKSITIPEYSTYDSTQAIQKAIDSFSSYGTIKIPSGKFLVTDTLNITNKSITFMGDGISSSTIMFNPANNRVLLNFIREKGEQKINAIKNITLKTAIQSCGTAVKIETSLTSSNEQVNGAIDTLLLNNVLITQEDNGYWTKFIHTVNNGGVHLLNVQMKNSIPDAQNDVNTIGIHVERTDSRVHIIRTLSITDFYIQRVYNAFKFHSNDYHGIESFYVSTGEVVGANTGILVDKYVEAVHLDGIHFDIISNVIDWSNGVMNLARFDGCDFRKGDNGSSLVYGPMFLVGRGEDISFTGCIFSGFNDSHSDSTNIAFKFLTSSAGSRVTRFDVAGCTFRNLYGVYGDLGASGVRAQSNLYAAIEDSVSVEVVPDTHLSLFDANVSKTFTVHLNGSVDEQIDVPVSPFFKSAYASAVLIPASQGLSSGTIVYYHFTDSTNTNCRFIVHGNSNSGTFRFSFMASGDSTYDTHS